MQVATLRSIADFYTRDINATIAEIRGATNNPATLNIPERVNGRTVTIPSSVTAIGRYAFWDCVSLQTVTFQSGSQLRTIYRGAFRHCINLTGFSIPSTVTYIGIYAFMDNRHMTSIHIPSGITAINHETFRGNYRLTAVSFASNSSLTRIGNSAFENSDLHTANIPAGVQTIGNFAFAYNRNLTAITFGNNSQLTSIGNFA